MGEHNSHMSRRDFLKYGLYAGFTAGLPAPLWLGGCEKKRLDVKPRNVILISIDTLRANYLGCYGYSRPTSPALDKLASEGLLFEDVSAPSPWTLPSHMSLLTGLYPSRHGVKSVRTKLDAHISPLAEILSQHGFATATVVNSIFLDRKFGFDRGFDYYSHVPDTNAPMGIAWSITFEGLKWLLKHQHERFFLFLHYYDLHSDYRSLPRYEKQFVRPYSGKADPTTIQMALFNLGKVSLNQDDAKYLADLYAASIRQMDDELNALFSSLKEKNLFDQTLLIITSDHGEEFLDHGGFLHGRTQFQELIHVPLIMRGPGLPKGRRIKEIASLVDVMPTVLALLGIPQPTSLDGKDLRPLWQKTDTQMPQRYIFAEADLFDLNNPSNEKNDIKRAVRHPRYKLHYNRLTKETALYDLVRDPHENIDVAGKHTRLLDLLLSELKEFMQINRTAQALPPLTTKEVEKLRGLGYLQ